MRAYKFKLIFLLWVVLYVAFFSSRASSTTIQRIKVLGFNEEQDRAAFILLHFGPSSGAPIARILVLNANNNVPIFSDQASFLSGNEDELAELASQLIEKNKSKLLELGISLVFPSYDLANYIVEKSTPLSIFGQVDSEYSGIIEFSIKASNVSTTCNYGGLTTEVCLSSNCSKIEECGAESIQLRNIYRSKNSLWFIIFQKHSVFQDNAAYLITLVGLKF